MDNLKKISDGISAFLSLIGVVLFGFVLLMGMIHKAGKTTWSKREKERRILRGKPNINLSSGEGKVELPWKDTGLIQGGFTALKAVGGLLSYVAIMLLLFAIQDKRLIAPDQIVQTVGILMYIPVLSGVGSIIRQAISNIRRFKLPMKSFVSLFVIVFVLAVASLLIYILLKPNQLALELQIVLFLAVSFYMSYLYGMTDGIEDANLEARFPLVSVVTTQGATINQLRLYEKTDTDYRFIGEDGADFIIPGAHIVHIKHTPEEISKNALANVVQSEPGNPSLFYDLFKKRSPTKGATDNGESPR